MRIEMQTSVSSAQLLHTSVLSSKEEPREESLLRFLHCEKPGANEKQGGNIVELSVGYVMSRVDEK